MFQQFTMMAVNALLSLLTPEKVKAFIKMGVKAVQDYVISTENTMDDQMVIPASNLVLAALEIPGPNGEIDIDSELRKLFTALGDLKTVFLDAGLDYIEDKVVQSENTIDDAVVLPACNLIRTVLRVPDND